MNKNINQKQAPLATHEPIHLASKIVGFQEPTIQYQQIINTVFESTKPSVVYLIMCDVSIVNNNADLTLSVVFTTLCLLQNLQMGPVN